MRMNILCKIAAILAVTVITFGHVGIVPNAQAQTDVSAREAQLRAELEKVEREIAAQQAILATEEAKAATYKGDIAILNAKIREAELKIQAKNIAIAALGRDIESKTYTIKELEQKIEKNKESLAELIRKTNELDEYSVVEIALSNKNLSDFFADIDSFDSIKVSMQDSFSQIRQNKESTETERDQLDDKRLLEIESRISVEAERSKISKLNNEKKTLLNLSVKEQNSYKGMIADKQKQAAQIRSALFALRDTGAIPFGKALEYANAASAKTGVRPAFILGILTQESNLGQNVGACYILDLTTGSSKGVNSGKVFENGIHPTRDLPILQTLLAELGRDPLQTKVSCPLSIGYGGAMGPAQFIPSTWNGMKSTIAAATGKAVPDPWDPQDAIMASALFLRDLGAGAGTESAEKNAACRYYSGRPCASSSAGNTYGNQVMAKTENIQVNMIDPLQGF